MDRRALILVGLAACGRGEERPRGAGGDAAPAAPAWRAQEVLECDFAVDLPAPITRAAEPAELAPEVVTYHYRGAKDARTLLTATCTVFPHGTPLPPPYETLVPVVTRNARPLEEVAGPVRDPHVERLGDDGIEYRFRYADGAVLEGRAYLVGLQIHELVGLHDGAAGEREDLQRLWRSYVRR